MIHANKRQFARSWKEVDSKLARVDEASSSWSHEIELKLKKAEWLYLTSNIKVALVSFGF